MQKHRTEQACSSVFYFTLWSSLEDNTSKGGKTKKTTTQISIETHQASPGQHAACKRRDKKTQRAEKKTKIFKTACPPTLHLLLFPLNHLLTSPLMGSSYELALAGVTLSFRDYSRRQGSGQYNGVQCLFGFPKCLTLCMFVFTECFNLTVLSTLVWWNILILALADGINRLCSFPVSAVWHFFTILFKTVESSRGTFLLVGTAIMLTVKDLLWRREAESKTNYQLKLSLFKRFNMIFDVHLLSLRALYEEKVKNHLHMLTEFC